MIRFDVTATRRLSSIDAIAIASVLQMNGHIRSERR
jgi:hypothetical protein